MTHGYQLICVCRLYHAMTHCTECKNHTSVSGKLVYVRFKILHLRCAERKADTACTGWEILRHRSLHNLEELLRTICCTNRKLLQKLNHQAAKTLECTWYPSLWTYLNQNILLGVHVNGIDATGLV